MKNNSLEQAIVYDPLIVNSNTLVTDAIALMSHARISCKIENLVSDQNFLLSDARASCVLVVDEDKLVGIFTKRDVVNLSADGRKIAGVKIAKVMATSVITINLSDFTDLFAALSLLKRFRIRHLPILDDQQKIVGLLTHESLHKILQPVDLLHLRLVNEVMNIRVVHTLKNTLLLDVTKLMMQHNVSSIVIIEEENSLSIPVGIITERDIVQCKSLDLNLEKITVDQVMSNPVFCVSNNENLWSVVMLMEKRRIHRVVVTGKQGELLGLITYTTLLQASNPVDIYKIVQLLEDKVSQLEGEKLQLLQSRNATLEQEVKVRTQELQKQTDRKILLNKIANKIRVSLDLSEILNTLSSEIRQLLNCDRVLIYKLNSDGIGMVIAEDVKPELKSFFQQKIYDPCFVSYGMKSYIEGKIRVVNDIDNESISPCHKELLQKLQIKAKILVPIVVQDQLWGLILACEKDHARIWQKQESEFLKQLSTHISIAIQQAEMYHLLQLELEERQRAEAALSKSEQLYRTILTNISDAVFITDHQGKFTFIAPNVNILFGYLPTEVASMDNISYLLGENIFDYHQLFLVGEIRNIEVEIKDKLGNLHTILVNVKQVQIGEGTILYTCRNISDRKHIEKELQDSEKRLRTIVETSTSGLVTVDMQGNILFVNPAAAKMFGRTKEELTGWPFALPYDLDNHRVQEIEIIQPTGQRRKVNMQPSSIIWESKKAFLMSLSDITDLKNTEKLLRESERKYRLLVENLPLGLIVHDPQGTIVNCNQKACELLGLNFYQLLGKSVIDPHWNFYREDETVMPISEYPVNLVIQTQKPLENYLLGIHKLQYQSLMWVLVNAFPVRDNINLQQIVVTFVDISEKQKALRSQKIAEEKLQQLNEQLEARVEERTIALQKSIHQQQKVEEDLRYSEERFRIALSNSPIVVFNQDVNLKYTWIYNPGFGLIPEEVLGKSDYDLFSAKDAEKLTEWKRQVLDTGMGIKEEVMIGEEENFICYVITIAPLRNRHGEIEGITCAALDITDRKKAEIALRESQYLVERITETSPDILYIYDLQEKRNVYTNQEIYRLIGYSPDEICSMGNQLFNNLVHPEDLPIVNDYHSRFINAGDEEIKEVEYRIQDKQGQWHWFLSHDTVFSRDIHNKPKQIVGAASEITERKEIEEKLRRTNAELAYATHMKNQFLANMSHELRTPLNAILGMSEGLIEGVFGVVSDRQTKAVRTIERSGQHLLELINDILDLSKVEAGKLDLQLSAANCKFLCDSSITFVKQQAMKKNINITLDVPANLPPIIVDERRFRQVLINLLNNAVKFTHEGGNIQLTVKLVMDENSINNINSQWMCFSIIDNGIGIATKDLDKLFQPFMQIDSSLNRQHNGTGLGLALVQQLVTLHQGKIKVTSEVNKGSCFQIYIPYQPIDNQPIPNDQNYKIEQLNIEKCHLQSWQNAQVLIIEDSTMTSEQLQRYLNQINLKTTIYSQGEGAIDEIIRIHPQLIFLDLILPNISGWEILEKIKYHPQIKHIPVVIISNIDERSRALLLGASEYLLKPITREKICQTLQKLHNSKVVELSQNHPNTIIKSPSQVILLVEDNEANIATTSNYLLAKGYSLIIAKSGEQAINLLNTHNPDLILMDIQMPGMDGMETISLIRQNPKFQQTPIIALTALAMTGDREKCLQVGANEYFTKPVKFKLLLEKMQQLLN